MTLMDGLSPYRRIAIPMSTQETQDVEMRFEGRHATDFDGGCNAGDKATSTNRYNHGVKVWNLQLFDWWPKITMWVSTIWSTCDMSSDVWFLVLPLHLGSYIWAKFWCTKYFTIRLKNNNLILQLLRTKEFERILDVAIRHYWSHVRWRMFVTRKSKPFALRLQLQHVYQAHSLWSVLRNLRLPNIRIATINNCNLKRWPLII